MGFFSHPSDVETVQCSVFPAIMPYFEILFFYILLNIKSMSGLVKVLSDMYIGTVDTHHPTISCESGEKPHRKHGQVGFAVMV